MTHTCFLIKEYRGTQVAVKRVIPPKSRKSKDAFRSSTIGTASGVKSGSVSGMNNTMGSWAMGSLSKHIGMSSQVRGNDQKRNSMSDAAKWNKMRREFVEEMRYLSKLRHPCVTTIMGAVLGEDPMLVMEVSLICGIYCTLDIFISLW